MLSVCIVESDTINQKILSKYIHRLGCTVNKIASTCSEALNHFITSKSDILLTEIFVGDSCGFELCRSIQELGKNPHIIIISASIQPEHFISAIQMKVTDYILKPISFERLRSVFVDHFNLAPDRKHVITFRHGSKLVDINEQDILYIEKISTHKCQVILKGGERFESTTPLKEICKQAAGHLVVPHRSFIINRGCIQSIVPSLYSYDNYEVIISDGTDTATVPLPRRRLKYIV